MKTRNITMLCAAMVLGMAPTVAPATVTAATTLGAPVMLAQAAPAPAAAPRVRAATPRASAVDAVEVRIKDLHTRLQITAAHADGIKKFVPVFSALYDSMSDAQKKNADHIFRRGAAQKVAR